MADVLMYGDTIRSPELRHEVPVPVPDPFIYVERNGSRWAFVGSFEVPRMREVEGLEPVPLEELGVDELIAQGKRWHEASPELILRACRRVGVEEAVAPRDFPLELADYLRANAVRVEAEGELFDRRRRVKTESELDGIRRAQHACERAMDAIRARLRAGSGVTCEELRVEANRVFSGADVTTPDIVIVSHGAQTAVGHEPGHGPIAEGEPVVVDLYPRDADSGCYADMTRTFCIGEPPEELVRYQGLVREALDLALGAIRPDVGGPRYTGSSASSSTGTASRPSSRSARARCSRRASSIVSVTASGSRCTRLRVSGATARSSSWATCSRSSRASTARASAAAGSRTSPSSPRMAARSSPTTRTTSPRSACLDLRPRS